MTLDASLMLAEFVRLLRARTGNRVYGVVKCADRAAFVGCPGLVQAIDVGMAYGQGNIHDIVSARYLAPAAAHLAHVLNEDHAIAFQRAILKDPAYRAFNLDAETILTDEETNISVLFARRGLNSWFGARYS